MYRADGMRVQKVSGFNLSWQWDDFQHTSGHYDENQAQNLPTDRYFYDGQMMFEDDHTVTGQFGGSVVTKMRYGIGARGVDYMEKQTGSGSVTAGFPLYDGHGNMVATLGRTGSSPYYALADARSYDVWGSVRSGNQTGDPKQRYCANLGHVQDDESGLIYMRARFYEPWTGRFVSEDAGMDGRNWYVFAGNNPVTQTDLEGRALILEAILALIKFLVGQLLMGNIEDITKRIDNITRYMNTLDEIIEHELATGKLIRGMNTAEDVMELRKDLHRLQGRLRYLQRQRAVLRASKIGTFILKLLGYSLVVSALIDDIELGVEGLGTLEGIYGT